MSAGPESDGAPTADVLTDEQHGAVQRLIGLVQHARE
jgi:hypothetical protein